jgi:SAM-dependent methyltransferase
MKLHKLLIGGILRHAVKTHGSKYLRGKLIDIGCGEKKYQDLLKSFVLDHIGLDHHQTLHDKSNIDIFGTAYDIPGRDDSFDSALCTEVLEHLEEPSKAIRECWRVLKPGGKAVYTCPFIWHLHEEPRDFFRYSEHGLRYLFEYNGFKVINIQPLNGFLVTFIQLSVYFLYRLNRGPLKLIPIIPVIGLLMQGLGLMFYFIEPRGMWPSHYVSIVQKVSR